MSMGVLSICVVVTENPQFLRDKRVVGVEVVPNLKFQPGAVAAKVHVIRARKLVVISAGTFGSPGILERSGIGARNVLDRAGVPQLVDLPGVGEHYQGQYTNDCIHAQYKTFSGIALI